MTEADGRRWRNFGRDHNLRRSSQLAARTPRKAAIVDGPAQLTHDCRRAAPRLRTMSALSNTPNAIVAPGSHRKLNVALAFATARLVNVAGLLVEGGGEVNALRFC